MIVSLRGRITELALNSLVIDVNGIGYESLISQNTYEYLSNSKQRIKISINARKNVESNFDKSKVLQQWIKVLNENMKVDN